MASGKGVTINLNNVKDFVYAFQNKSDQVKERLRSSMEIWAESTKNEYDSLTGYGSGFSKLHLESFAAVENSKKINGLHVAVGHRAFIAKFLEVGTKAHAIPHKNYVVNVSGIKGSKALYKAWNKNRKNILTVIEKEVADIICKGGR